MNQRERPQQSDFQRLIQSLRRNEKPLAKYLSRPIAEIFTSGRYQRTVLNPQDTAHPLSDQRRFEALRMITIGDDDVPLSTVLETLKNKRNTKTVMDAFAAQTGNLFKFKDQFFNGMLLPIILGKLRQADLQTIAAMLISTSTSSRKVMCEVVYPEIFQDVFAEAFTPDILKMYPQLTALRREAAFFIASHFLRTTPMGTGRLNLTL